MSGLLRVSALTPDQAVTLDGMMASENEGYLRHFTAFRPPHMLAMQVEAAKADRFFGLWQDEALSGFYCLRGFDEGYSRPSFGVYVHSRHRGRGLGARALEEALAWCAAHGIERMMLKTYDANTAAHKLYATHGFVDAGRCASSGQLVMEKVIA